MVINIAHVFNFPIFLFIRFFLTTNEYFVVPFILLSLTFLGFCNKFCHMRVWKELFTRVGYCMASYWFFNGIIGIGMLVG
jgi:hypothetical protein